MIDKPENKHDKILRIQDVMQVTGLPRSSIYAKLSIEDFPKPINIGVRSVGWLSSEIDGWISARIAESRGHK